MYYYLNNTVRLNTLFVKEKAKNLAHGAEDLRDKSQNPHP